MHKYREIFLDLEQKILEMEYPPNTLLPSENQLMEIYNTSRETVRKALNLLINAGYIQKKQGKGSIVLDFHQFNFPISGLTSFKELQKMQHIQAKTAVVSLEVVKVSKKLSQATGWKEDTEVWKLIRQRNINGETIILDKDYLRKDIIPDLSLDICENSIYDYIENELELVISYANKEVTVEHITKEDKELMTLHPEDTHVVVVRSVVFLDDTTCFEYTESRHRLDKFKFTDFARRRKF
ncbi:trehalose operon repressor [Vagococcus humatus]|uniref:Trehalose operon repressor n=1 Tax=Vagococcus humatus TaxID=1889241 RepID=A0A3R9YXP9_9ENTE|nr:trehalose operon repressor [Vagococcus humatus]RST89847.1 trehalose operon repressor [Vagococcus humatus]